MKKLTQGAKANQTGRYLEDAVEDFLNEECGVFPISYSDWANESVIPPYAIRGILLKNVPYINIYGGNGWGEFLLSVEDRDDVRIECRLQNSAGSVDEKLPYLFETAAHAFEERIVILVVEGDGYKRGAKKYLKAKCESVRYKQVLMFTLEEFKTWARRYLASKNYSLCSSAG